jgi:hypothetical protein
LNKEQRATLETAKYIDSNVNEKLMSEFVLFGDVFLRILPVLENEE